MKRIWLAVFVFFLSACATLRPTATDRGQASWYGRAFQGRKTASGEIFDRLQLTAAHRTLPFGTKVQLTNVASGRKVVVRINDRGPFAGNRVIDVSEAAARDLGFLNEGHAEVRLKVLE